MFGPPTCTFGVGATNKIRLKVESSKRQSLVNQTSDNFTVNVRNPAGSMQGSWRLVECFIPNAAYNVCSLNNIIRFTDNNISRTATIPPGFYTGTTIAAAIGTAMTSASTFQTYTASLSDVSGQLTISAAAAFVLNFSNNLNSAALILGFLPQDTASATTQTGTNIVDVSWSAGRTAYNILIGGNTGGIMGGTYSSDGACYALVLPVSSNTQGWTYYTASAFDKAPKLTFNSQEVTLSVQVLDDFGRAFPLQGVNFYFVMQRDDD